MEIFTASPEDVIEILKQAQPSGQRYCFSMTGIEDFFEKKNQDPASVKKAVDQCVRNGSVLKIKESDAVAVGIRVPWGGRANAVYYITTELFVEAKEAHEVRDRNLKRKALWDSATTKITERHRDEVTDLYERMCEEELMDPIFETPFP